MEQMVSDLECFDDFTLAGSSASPIHAQYVFCLKFASLSQKIVSSMSLLVLNINLDSVTQIASLPSDKLEALQQLGNQILGVKALKV